MTSSEKIKFVLVRSVGNFLLLFSLYGVAATFGPALYHEATFRVAQARGVEFVVSNPSQPPLVRGGASPSPSLTREGRGGFSPREGPGFAEVLAGSKEQVLIPKDTAFSIVIPKIGASAKVIPNVDPANPQDFLPRLQEGIAHAKGSVFPGMPGNTYLFAHSVDNWWNVGRYNAVFYLLKDVSPGDDIIVFFEDRRYDYIVEQTMVKEANDTGFLSQAHGSQEQLILQTCWPPGTTWKRLYVIAKPKSQ